MVKSLLPSNAKSVLRMFQGINPPLHIEASFRMARSHCIHNRKQIECLRDDHITGILSTHSRNVVLRLLLVYYVSHFTE